MKKLILSLLLSLIAFSGFSQTRFGVNAGINLVNQITRSTFQPTEFVLFTRENIALQIGADLIAPLSNEFTLLPEFRFYYDRMAYEKDFSEIGIGTKLRYSLTPIFGLEGGFSFLGNISSPYNTSKINFAPSVGASAFVTQNLKVNLLFDYCLRPRFTIDYGNYTPISSYDPLLNQPEKDWEKYHNQRIILSASYYFNE